MIEQRKINHIIIKELKRVSGCEVIKSNQTHKIPDYPFISFTIITPVHQDSGTYAVENDIKSKALEQTWSITIQSDNDTETLEKAMLAWDWFVETGNFYFREHNIVVVNVGDITNRDNFISIEYEYRQGFDVRFRFMHEIEITQEEKENIIENLEFNVEKE